MQTNNDLSAKKLAKSKYVYAAKPKRAKAPQNVNPKNKQKSQSQLNEVHEEGASHFGGSKV